MFDSTNDCIFISLAFLQRCGQPVRTNVLQIRSEDAASGTVFSDVGAGIGVNITLMMPSDLQYARSGCGVRSGVNINANAQLCIEHLGNISE